MKQPVWLPYVALSLTCVVLLFGDNIVGNSHADSSKLAVTLATLELEAKYQREAAQQQLEVLNKISKTQQTQGSQLNEHSKDIAVITTRIDNYVRVLNSKSGHYSGQFSSTQYPVGSRRNSPDR